MGRQGYITNASTYYGPIQRHSFSVDEKGRNRMFLRFYIENAVSNGPYLGVVQVDLIESSKTRQWNYRYIVVNVYDRSKLHDDPRMADVSLHRQVTTRAAVVKSIQVLVTPEYQQEVQELARRASISNNSSRLRTDGGWLGVLRPRTWLFGKGDDSK
ncbi:hypothetical protein EV182_002739 [Spiromyces aspiralis]|uniref:Uncharacterized protein n=1 Tax=Spiromyces aspiralis TaxID=68401 RepID=A0ACC1HST4_9FUNG|nr:hypothetical protein EV182_002739 [Spiromyces aspiralis]